MLRIKYATANDGTEIHIVLIYNKKAKKRIGSSPLLMETYGGGGDNFNPHFDSKYIPLMNRGYVIAYAIVRGGGELGTKWTVQAKGIKVAQSAEDFADCAKYLIDKNITNPDKLFAYGKSHGGFVMNYVANYYTELFNGIILDVPFVDILTELADSTANDVYEYYDGYGSPYIDKEYPVLKRNCPYQNITTHNYPNMLYFGAWQDINVKPSHSIKAVAKLRATKTDDNLLLLRVLMNSGHGTSGSKYYTKKAWMYSFMLHCLEN